MGKLFEIKLEKHIEVSREEAWEVLDNHQRMADWIKPLESVEVLRKGGVGAKRALVLPFGEWATIHERIIHYNPPHGYQYEITKGVPGLEYHLGQIRIHTDGENACWVEWIIDLEFKYTHPIIVAAPLLVRALEYNLKKGLETLKEHLEIFVKADEVTA